MPRLDFTFIFRHVLHLVLLPNTLFSSFHTPRCLRITLASFAASVFFPNTIGRCGLYVFNVPSFRCTVMLPLAFRWNNDLFAIHVFVTAPYIFGVKSFGLKTLVLVRQRP